MTSLYYAKQLSNLDQMVVTRENLARLLNLKSSRTTSAVMSRLVKHGFLTRLESGKYLNLTHIHQDKFTIANQLYTPSYVSLESALNFYGILDQFPFMITSVTLKKSIQKEVKQSGYYYTHVTEALFTGFEKKHGYLIATKEKALFDYLYLIAKGLRTTSLLDEFSCDRVNLRKVRQYTNLIKAKSTKSRLFDLIQQLALLKQLKQ